MSLSKEQENALLSRLTFITSLGDFLSYFSVLMMIYELSQSVAVSAYSVAVKTVSVALGGLILPRVASHFSFRQLMIWSQLVSGGLIVFLLFYWHFAQAPLALVVFIVLFLQSLFKQIFEGAREARSRVLGEVADQRNLQAQIMHRFYSAQFVGPILSFLLIKYFNLTVPLVLDAVSFFVAAYIAKDVGAGSSVNKYSLLAPFKYLSENKPLLWIFLIRSVGMWIPIGAFNYIVFPVITEHYGLELIQSVWVYVTVGLGSMLAASWLKSSHVWLSRQGDWRLACFGFFAIAATRVAFINLPHFFWALVILVLAGFCNGLNATVTQSIRRKVASSEQLPEVIGLELFIGRMTDWGVSSVLLFLLTAGHISAESGIYFSAIGFVVLGILAFGLSRTESGNS